MSNNFAMCWLPEPDQVTFCAEDDSVIPPPDHGLSRILRASKSHQVTG
jgi:hypothetical protein